jgi:hypothetical protein
MFMRITRVLQLITSPYLQPHSLFSKPNCHHQAIFQGAQGSSWQAESWNSWKYMSCWRAHWPVSMHQAVQPLRKPVIAVQAQQGGTGSQGTSPSRTPRSKLMTGIIYNSPLKTPSPCQPVTTKMNATVSHSEILSFHFFYLPKHLFKTYYLTRTAPGAKATVMYKLQLSPFFDSP